MDNRIRELAVAGYIIYPQDGNYTVETAEPRVTLSFPTYEDALAGAWAIFQKKSQPNEFSVVFRYDRGLGIEYATFNVVGDDPESEARRLFDEKMKVEPKMVVIHEVRVRPRVY